MFVGSGVEKNTRSMPLEDLPDAIGIRHVGDQRDNDVAPPILKQLLFNLEKLNLRPLQEQQLPWTRAEDLPTELATDRATGTCDHDDLSSNPKPDGFVI
jgi:hypothetical protein